MFQKLTKKERAAIVRTLRWVLVATQSTDADRATVQKAIDILESEPIVTPEEVSRVR